MFAHRMFDVEIKRSLAGDLGWPEPGEAAEESCLGGNRQYGDLRGSSWTNAKAIFDQETSLIARIESAEDPEEEYEVIGEELGEGEVDLWGLDLGVASTAIALCAAGCVTCSCCNAGAFGGHHAEHYPVVAFYAKPRHVELLLKCAEEAHVGLENYQGRAIVFANDIRKMRLFAAALIRERGGFRALARNGTRKRGTKAETEARKTAQLGLPFDGER